MSKKGITARYEQEEYELLIKKARSYGYSSLASYIRDISLHEVVVKECYEDKKEICDEFATIRKLMIKEEKELKEMVEKISNNYEDRIYFEGAIQRVIERRKMIEKILNDRLFRSFKEESKKIIEEKEKI